jgi:hypothetical protein
MRQQIKGGPLNLPSLQCTCAKYIAALTLARILNTERTINRLNIDNLHLPSVYLHSPLPQI